MSNTKYQELRLKTQCWPKHQWTKTVARAPLIHEGFPGQFNISYSEYYWLKEYGNYINFDHTLCIQSIQSCIRLNDFPSINGNDGYRYLGVFELADVTGAVSFSYLDQPSYAPQPSDARSTKHHEQIESFLKYLKFLRIPRDQIYASYCAGGSVSELTNGKYIFPFRVPEDSMSREAFLSAEVPEENLIPDTSRNTLLALHLYRPTLWGYRNEVFVNLGTKKKQKLLDIGTAEVLFWKPIFQGDESQAQNIIGLEENTTSNFFITGVGLERLCMTVNNLERVHDADYIKPFYDCLQKQTGTRDFLAGESLRALHRIYSDILKYNIPPLSRQRRYKINTIIRNVLDARLSSSQIRDLLKVHTETQPWHRELEAGIDFTIRKIETYQNGVVCENARGEHDTKYN
jgi:hypothetical protein